MTRTWVLESRQEDVVTLTFNDPDHLNAMTRDMGEAFRDRVEELCDDSTLRAVVVTGGGRAFSAGGDLDMIVELAHEARSPNGRSVVEGFMRSFYELFLSVRRLPCPSIAAINGHAIGAGLCIALACDFRYVAREAKLGLNFTKLGLHPGMGASWTLPRLIGPAHAAELLYTSRLIGGEEAARIGIANRCLASDEVLPAALESAGEIAACAPFANRELKRGLAQSPGEDLGGQLDYEAASQGRCFETEDILEGLAAAKEKRGAKFEGR